MDVLIPLAATSPNSFLELRLALRSLAQCTDVGTVYVITTAYIPWLQNVTVVTIDDPFTNNKDKNLIRKIHLTLQLYPEITDFVLFTDDYIITKPISLNDIPDVYNSRSLDDLNTPNNTKWQNRLRFTLAIMKLMGKDVSCNWDAHVPIRLNSEKILNGLAEMDYLSGGANFTLVTLLANLCNKSKEEGVLQNLVKSTCESKTFTIDWEKLFIGYNDAAFNNGLKDILLKRFDTKSIYENNKSSYLGPIVVFLTNVNDSVQLLDCIKHTRHSVLLMPWDDDSEKAVKSSGVNIISREGLSAHNMIMLAKLTAEYCVLFDGNYHYDRFYFEDCVSDIAETTVTIYDPAMHRGIVNNKLLDMADINKIPDTNLTGVFEYLVDNVRPSIILRENEPEEL